MTLPRRAFLKGMLGTAAGVAVGLPGCGRNPLVPEEADATADGWRAGDVVHLLPAAGPRRIRLKASFRRPLGAAPRLEASGRVAEGQRGDTRGLFYRFDLRGLEPDRVHTLSLRDAAGAPLCESWPLRTLPAPDATPRRLRLLVYTCAGGPDDLYDFGLWNAYVPIAQRQRMLRRALAFEPDAVVANGDHVYWDLLSRFGWAMGRSWRAAVVAGRFDRAAPVLGSANEDVLLRAFGPQIAGLYGVLFRSVPVWFLQDDHDYGENDEASDALRTFPPDRFMRDLARTTQHLYYPELPADEDMPGAFVSDDGLSESFGSLRWGRLFEALLYDCRRYLTNSADPELGHAASVFVPPAIERWLHHRTAASPCAHVAHMPSTPVLWSVGKWGEWYPDHEDASGVLRADAGKPYWPDGWGAQHDRLLAAASARRDRIPLFVSGDLHATAAGRIRATRGRSLASNPVVSLLVGAVGTGALGWPSRFRGQIPVPSETVEAETLVAPLEENGFSLLDLTPGEVRVSQFRWRPADGADALDRLEPFSVLSFRRPGAG